MLRGILLVFLGASSFGVLSTFVKLAYKEGYSLGDVTGIQAFWGMLTLWILYFTTKGRLFKDGYLDRKQMWQVFLMGASTGLVSLFYYQCVKLIPASIAILLLMQFTWISMLLEYLFFKKKPTLVQFIAVIVILFGTLLAGNFFASGRLEIDIMGVFYGMLAAFCYAIFLLVSGRIGNALNPLHKSALMLTGACILIFVIFPPTFIWNGAITAGLWKWGIPLALFGTVIPPIFFAIGIPKTGVGLSSIISSAELPVAVLMSSIILGESVSAIQWLGVAIILSAIILSNAKKIKLSRK